MDATTLLADRPDGSRRTAVLKTDDEGISVRAKSYEDDERIILQIRAWVEPLGHYLHAYFDADTGALIVSTTGKQDADAYTRAVTEMKRRGINLGD
jgi:hypothetical protein